VEHFKRKTNRAEEKKKIRKRVVARILENMTSFFVILFVIRSYELKIQMIATPRRYVKILTIYIVRLIIRRAESGEIPPLE